jgi:hypothetical protein
LGFLTAAVFVVLEDGNQHNLANAAQVLLAVPAVAWLPGQASSEKRRFPVLLVWLIFLPGALFTLSAYVGRPPIPLTFADGAFRRTPADSPLNHLYDWVRNNTPGSAIFVIDPTDPVKMSGNASELPAFTGRTLFTDQPSYLTPFADAGYRLQLATRATHGEQLSAADRAYLERFARTVFLVSHHADRADLRARLDAEFGSPVFSDRWVAVYRVVEGGSASR